MECLNVLEEIIEEEVLEEISVTQVLRIRYRSRQDNLRNELEPLSFLLAGSGVRDSYPMGLPSLIVIPDLELRKPPEGQDTEPRALEGATNE